MTFQEFRELLSYAGAFGAGGVIAVTITWLLLNSYATSYLTKKGENLATREDIAVITHEIEAVKTQYMLLVEESKAKHQLRMAALDKRLQAHQESFSHWREIFGAVHTSDIGKVVIKCQSWWEQNCLYLEPRVRDAFVNAYSAAHSHQDYIQSRAEAELVKENWARITAFPNILFESVQLPPLTEVERRELMPEEVAAPYQKNT